MPPARLDLNQPRDFADLLRETVRTFRRHAVVFLGATLLVTVPAGVLLDGIWAGVLREGYYAWGWGPNAVWLFLVAPMVIALHVGIVQRLGEGVVTTPWRALRATSARVVLVVVTFALLTVAVLAGLVLLVIPGVYVGVLLYFAPEAATAERAGPAAALRSSARLVRGRWWRCFRYLIGSALILAIVPGIMLELALSELDEAAGHAAYLAADIVFYGVLMSLGTLFDALLYFDLRHRQAAEV